jgi:hypothetical protein
MSDQAPEASRSVAGHERPRKRWWDIPLLIKIFLLLIVIALLLAELFSGEYSHRGWWEWLILFLKIVLIIALLILIWVQRWLKCELTAPTGCVKETLDKTAGSVYVVVEGTATGVVFGHYTVDIRQNGDPPFPGVVGYPGGGASGSAPVVNGELARIDTAALSDGAYIVTLTVYPAGFGSPKSCSITFNLLKVVVVITHVGKIPAISMAPVPDNPNPFDETSMLRKDFALAPPPHDNQLVSVGGAMTIDGSAYVFGCNNRKLKKYELRYARINFPAGTDLPQPATLDPIPADWPVGNRFELLEYVTPDQYLPWTRVGPAPRNLINSWGLVTIFGMTFYVLQGNAWNSTGVGSGRYSLLLTAEDSIGATYHDVQHIWLDNEPVYGKITGIENVVPCADLTLSQFVAAGMSVQGIAWDRLIDDLAPDSAPNDNFDSYRLRLVKQGGGTHEIGTFSNRVIAPFRKTGAPPADAEADILANFDIVSVIDAGSGSSDPAVAIPRHTGCAYYLTLDVWDRTRLNDDSGTHSATSIWPFCIANDIVTT